MPIVTRLPKSIPSSRSRKPCPKCCRDCSPSVTTSMPAVSCSLSAISTASRCAWASDSRGTRHGAQSFSGSASQDGLGRLPAMVVWSIGSGDLDDPGLEWLEARGHLGFLFCGHARGGARPCVFLVDTRPPLRRGSDDLRRLAGRY